MEVNKIICGDCQIELSKLPDNSINLVVFSPTYDGLREYNGYHMDLKKIGT